jgi:hypothetical protein
MNSFSLADETLNLNSTAMYQLSIEAGLSGFSYCILDSTRNKYIAVKHESASSDDLNNEEFIKKIEQFIDSDEYLNCKYKSVRFLLNTQKTTLVPEPLFDKTDLASFFSFNHSFSEAETLHYNHLKNAQTFNIFALPFHLVETIYMRFANAKLYHQASSLIENSLIRFKTKGNKQKVILQIFSDFFDILVLSHDKVQLYNNFSFRNPDECMYFIMYIYEQLKLDPETVELTACGDISKTTELFQKIKKFIRVVQMDKLNDQFLYSYIVNDIPQANFINLFNVYRCE